MPKLPSKWNENVFRKGRLGVFFPFEAQDWKGESVFLGEVTQTQRFEVGDQPKDHG